jgi:hypothetical protein
MKWVDNFVRPMRITFLAIILLPGSLYAQSIQRKHLVVGLNAGAGVLHLASDRPDLSANGECGAVRFTFAFALSDRWSIGGHYDRVGTAHHPGLDRLHMTTYTIEGTYRPWTGNRAGLECTMGLGSTAAALFPPASQLPMTATGAVFMIGTRYLHLISHTLGWSIALDHAATSSNELVLEGGVVEAPNGKAHVQWNSQRVTAGLFVRF